MVLAQKVDRQIQWVRHGEVVEKGRLFGRTDVDILPIEPIKINAIIPLLDENAKVFSSPAKRAMKTENYFYENQEVEIIEGFWEQDFGDFEGVEYSEIPDLGTMTREEISSHQPPNGESFEALVKRVRDAINELPEGNCLVFAHAGVIRAALGIALGNPSLGLAFQIDNLSLTKTSYHANSGAWAVHYVNLVGQI